MAGRAVSPEVASKLEAQQKDAAMFRLAPQEWKSGDIPWLLDIVAPSDVAKAWGRDPAAIERKERPR